MATSAATQAALLSADLQDIDQEIARLTDSLDKAQRLRTAILERTHETTRDRQQLDDDAEWFDPVDVAAHIDAGFLRHIATSELLDETPTPIATYAWLYLQSYLRPTDSPSRPAPPPTRLAKGVGALMERTMNANAIAPNTRHWRLLNTLRKSPVTPAVYTWLTTQFVRVASYGAQPESFSFATVLAQVRAAQPLLANFAEQAELVLVRLWFAHQPRADARAFAVRFNIPFE